MVLIDLFVCDAGGNMVQGGDTWNAPFEAPPHIGETVQIASAGGVDTYAVLWVTHVFDADNPKGYEVQVGITQA